MIHYKTDGIMIDNEFYCIDEIITGVNMLKIKEQGLAVLSMEWPITRNFDGVSEIVCAPLKTIRRLMAIMTGHMLSFGEIAGKHSNIYGLFKEDSYSIELDPETVNAFMVRNPTGRVYDHSFLDAFISSAEQEIFDPDEGITDDILKEFLELVDSIGD